MTLASEIFVLDNQQMTLASETFVLIRFRVESRKMVYDKNLLVLVSAGGSSRLCLSRGGRFWNSAYCSRLLENLISINQSN